jgi:sec-independent protein translocase protein TatB
MFDIGWSELVVIGVVALIAIGPKELPGVLRTAGYWMGKVRRMASDFQGQFQEAMREAEMADLKKQADDLNAMARGLTSDIQGASYISEPAQPSSASSAVAETTAPAAETPPDVTTAATDAAPLPPPGVPDVAALSEPPVPVTEPVPETAAPPAPEAAEPPRRAAGTA